MICYFADRKLNIIGHATTSLPDGLTIIEDLLVEDVKTGVSTFECKIPFTKATRADVEKCAEVGNYLLRSDGDESGLFTIVEAEVDTKAQTVYLYAEDDGLDLLNDVVGKYEADKAYNIAHYINKYAKGAGFVIGTNQVSKLTRKLSWDGESTASERISSIATQFSGAEVSYSFKVDGLNVVKKYINIYKQRGKDVGCTLYLNKDVDSIVTSKTVTNLATALQCTGGTPENSENPITLSGYKYDDGDFYVDGGVLKSRKALKAWSRYLWKTDEASKSGGHIVKQFSFDTTDKATLCAHAITELKELREMEINYAVDIKKLPENVKIGDRVNIVDDAGGLYLSTRILRLEKSVADQEFKATLGEHLLKSSGIAQKVVALAKEFATVANTATRAKYIAAQATTAAQAAEAQAQSALEEADEALTKAGEAETAANTATQSAVAATTAANTATAKVQAVEKTVETLNKDVSDVQALAGEAKTAAGEAQTAAGEAASAAAQALADAAAANAAVTVAQGAAETAQQAAEDAQDTADQAIKDAGAAKDVADAAKIDAANAEKDILSLGERLDTVSNTMQADYARKTDLTEATASLQTQITQNAGQIESTASRVQTIDETANNAKEMAEAAQTKADAAQTAATKAEEDADKAQAAADSAATAAANAKTEADTAKAAAAEAQSKANQAATDLAKAEEHLESVKSDVNASKEQVEEAEKAVEAAQAAAEAAKADATAAAGVAADAQSKAATAEQNATNAQSVANEAKGKAEDAQAVANAAQGDATAAKNTANAANATAAAAQTAANEAKSNASAAQTKADKAAEDAAKAQSAADAADAKAAQAATDLATAQANLTAVTNRVGATEEDIAAAQEAVEAAQAAADKAKADAATAQSTANTAKTNAAKAQTAANNAKTAADNAQAAADDAAEAAEAAQAAVDALAVRVTTAETNITQNSEKIEFAATKTEVANTLSGYYTKAQTDAAITTKADSITSSVSATYATKTALSATDTKAGNAATAAKNAQDDVDALETNVTTNYATKSLVTQTSENIKSEVSSTYVKQAALEMIKGTQTATTGAWTGAAPFASLADGQQILYWLPFAGSGNATLNLTLSGGGTTGAKNCYYGGTTRLTTQYPAGSAIRLVYRENVTIGGTAHTGWWADANYDSGNYYDRQRYQQAIKCGTTAIVAANIIVGANGVYSHLKTGAAFDVSYPILYASSAIAANATGTNNYISIAFTITTTQALTLTAYKPVFIKGTLNGKMFTPVSTAPLTQVEPTSDDGYFYILLGTAYSTKAMYLLHEHPMFKFDGTGLKSIEQIVLETQTRVTQAEDRITSEVSGLNGRLSTVEQTAGGISVRLETVEADAIVSTVEQFYQSSSATALSGGAWSNSQPTWTAGKYIWRRTLVTYGDGTTDYTPNSTGVCITGNTGATGGKGDKGDTGATGAQGYSVVAAVPRPSFTEAQWTTYGTVGHVESWGSTSEIRNGCRVGDIFTVVGTATDTKNAHVLYYRSDNASGNLHGECIAHSIAERGATGAGGAAGKDGQMLYATCPTAAATVAKVATLASGSITLAAGVAVSVKFTYANTAASPTLNVNSTGAKAIWLNGAVVTSAGYWVAGAVITFVYDGTRWHIADGAALTKAAEAAKTASNFLSYDSTNGLLIGNKTSGSWSGSRAQITSSEFNILNSSGSKLASFGASTIELGNHAETAELLMCGGMGRISYEADTLLGSGKYLKLSGNAVSVKATSEASLVAQAATTDYGLIRAQQQAVELKAVYGVTQSDGVAVLSGSEVTVDTTQIYGLADTIHLVSRYGMTLDDVTGQITTAVRLHAGGGIRLGNGGQIVGGTTSGTDITMVQMNASNYTMFGYGGYANNIGATYLDGNVVNIRSKGNINLTGTVASANTINANGGIVLPNNYTIACKNSSGTTISSLFMNTSNNLVIGYGLYSAGSGTTIIDAGSTITLQNTTDSVSLVRSTSGSYTGYFRPGSNGTVTCGTNANRWYAVYAANGTIQTSDRREKENIVLLEKEPVSELFDLLQPVKYNFIKGNGRTCYGLIAQDVIAAMQKVGIEENALQMVHHDFNTDEETGEVKDTYGLAYENLIALLIYEVQQLKKEIHTLKQRKGE